MADVLESLRVSCFCNEPGRRCLYCRAAIEIETVRRERDDFRSCLAKQCGMTLALAKAAEPFAEHALGIHPDLLKSDITMREQAPGLGTLKFSDFRHISEVYGHIIQKGLPDNG